jgi:hypothetical protein
MIFEQQTHIEQVVHKVMLHTHSLLRVQRVQVMLLHNYAADQMPPTDYSHLRLLTASVPVNEQSNVTAEPSSGDCVDGAKPRSTLHVPEDEVDEEDEDGQETAIKRKLLQEVISQQESDREQSEAEAKDGDPLRFSRVFDLQGQVPLTRCEQCRTIEMRECHKPFEPLLESSLEPLPFDKLQFFETNCDIEEKVAGVAIAEHVALTGSALSISDCRTDEVFRVDRDDSLQASLIDRLECDQCRALNRAQPRSLLCMPIRNAQHKVIGVAQLTNKLNGSAFTPHDQSLFEVSRFSRIRTNTDKRNV